ncbi:gamma-glutamyltransferase family protein [Alteribacter aurantiacus]|uniref:gamma-glutamyltransferase family protein n=1 Tax=Alteribacter aurantiacus TaxID=254410 RepID=UPI0003F6CA59|nr:gamma-glutamyltransferase [Alteribacter aurantiacus]
MNKTNAITLGTAALLLAGGGYYFWQQSTEADSGKVPDLTERPAYVAEETDEPTEYGVTTDNDIATQIGMDILEDGGNAVDAAIAVSYALGTVEPYASGMGGGGVMMVHPPKEEPTVYDYRTMAPVSGPVPDSGTGVPGFVAGLEKIHEDFGFVSLPRLLDPAIDLAENGFEPDEDFERRLINATHRMPVDELDAFYKDGYPIRAGETFIQEDLAESMKLIQEEGAEAFYEGAIADTISSDVIGVKREDLRAYEVLEREPLRGSFYGYDVYAPPAPSSGTMLIQSLQMTEQLGIEDIMEDEGALAELLGQMNRTVHKDRNENIGDPDFVDVHERTLTSRDYTRNLAQDVTSETSFVQLDNDADRENHANTTHFVIVDKDGMMVSGTNTISNFFGSGIYVDGFFMTNQLRNFSDSSTSPNRSEKGKRSNSYMVPSILSHNNEPVIGVGSAGGRRIPSVMTQTLLRSIVDKESVQDAIDAPRHYLEVFEDTLYTENPDAISGAMHDKYDIKQAIDPFNFGSVNILVTDPETGELTGGADPRRNGTWKKGGDQ